MNYSFEAFFHSLTPNILRSELERNVDMDIGELENRTLPMFERAQGVNLTSVVEQRIHSAIMGRSSKKTVYDLLFDTIQNVVDNRALILKMVSTEFNKENPKEVSDYYKLNILKYLEAFRFLSKYAIEYIGVIVIEAMSDKEYLSLPDIKMSAKFITDNDNMAQIAQVCNQLNRPLHEFLNEIKSLKGHQFVEYDWKANAEATAKRVDAFKSGLIPVRWNPLYHAQLMFSTWASENDTKTQHEYERLQYLLLQLKDQQENTTDKVVAERLKKQILYRSDQINKLQVSMEKIEERYAV
jgi:hypothetical protein